MRNFGCLRLRLGVGGWRRLRRLLLRGRRRFRLDVGSASAVEAAIRKNIAERLPVVGEHCSDTEELVRALEDGSAAALDRGHRRAAELAERDALFPDVLPALAAALGGSRSLVLG